MLDELAELVEAAGGRTLGLFSSMRAAQAAAEELRGRLDVPDPAAGRGDARRADQELRGRPEDLPVRHALALAGRRCARAQLSAGGHGPDPVPAPRRPADERPPEGGGGGRRQRLHGGRRHARRAADGAGRGPARTGHGGPGRRRRTRPAAGHGPLRQLSAGLAARLLVHDGPQPGAPLAGRDRRGGQGGGGRGGAAGPARTRRPPRGYGPAVHRGSDSAGPRNRRSGSRGPVRGGGEPVALRPGAAPPPPCRGWSPRHRGSAGTRRCAGAATHGRPRA